MFVGGRIVRRKFNRYKSRFLNLSLMKLESMEPVRRSASAAPRRFRDRPIAEHDDLLTVSGCLGTDNERAVGAAGGQVAERPDETTRCQVGAEKGGPRDSSSGLQTGKKSSGISRSLRNPS